MGYRYKRYPKRITNKQLEKNNGYLNLSANQIKVELKSLNAALKHCKEEKEFLEKEYEEHAKYARRLIQWRVEINNSIKELKKIARKKYTGSLLGKTIFASKVLIFQSFDVINMPEDIGLQAHQLAQKREPELWKEISNDIRSVFKYNREKQEQANNKEVKTTEAGVDEVISSEDRLPSLLVIFLGFKNNQEILNLEYMLSEISRGMRQEIDLADGNIGLSNWNLMQARYAFKKNKRKEDAAKITSMSDKARQGGQQLRDKALNAIEFDAFTCPYCNKDTTKNNSELDHIHPIAKGGLTTQQNTVLICHNCNAAKSDLTLRVFCRTQKFNFEEIASRLEEQGKDI